MQAKRGQSSNKYFDYKKIHTKLNQDGKSVKNKVSLMDIQYHVSYEAFGHMILYIQVQLNTFDTITKDYSTKGKND